MMMVLDELFENFCCCKIPFDSAFEIIKKDRDKCFKFNKKCYLNRQRV